MTTSLEHFGTIAFDLRHMRATVAYGELVQHADGTAEIVRDRNPCNLCLSLWMATVPETYREQVATIAMDVARHHLKGKADERARESIIREICGRVWREVEPQP